MRLVLPHHGSSIAIRNHLVTSSSARKESAGRVPAVIQMTALHDHLDYASFVLVLLLQLTSLPPILDTSLARTGLTGPCLLASRAPTSMTHCLACCNARGFINPTTIWP